MTITRGAPAARATAARREPAARGGTVAALLAVGAGAALVVVARLWGEALTAGGAVLHLAGGYPLAGQLDPRLVRGLVLPAVVALAVVAWGPSLAQRLRWPPLLVLAATTSAAWAVALAASDGAGALSRPLQSRYEYLADLPRVDGLRATLEGFVAHVPEGAPGFTWTTHVGGHPPGALLGFAALDRIALGGAGWAAAVCISVGASAVAAVLLTVRVLGGEAAARAAAPYLVLAPTALWVATSADALFCGVAAWGVAALAYAPGRTGARAAVLALAGGALLGAGLLLSYGLTLMALIAAAAVLRQRRRALRTLGTGLAGTAGVLGGVALLGFVWPVGLLAASERVRAGPAFEDRPTGYFLLAGAAALCLVAGPATVGALGRLARTRDGGRLGPALVLPLAALATMGLALASTLSKGEVERIHLPFLVWLLPVAALLPPRQARWWLAAAAVTAIAVQACWRLKW